MALKSTIFKVELQLADIDHNDYSDLSLTLARHPSETDERMMVRLLALILHAHQVRDVCAGDGRISFGSGLSSPDQPDVVLEDFGGRIRHWIEVGQPDDKALARACGKADAVTVYAYGNAAEVWWRGIESKLARLDKLQVWRLPAADVQALGKLAARTMSLQATLLEGQLSLSDGSTHLSLEACRWK